MFKKVFGNLALDFGLLLFLAVIVSVFALIGLKRVEDSYELLVNHSFEIERLAAKIETDLLHSENLKEDFLLYLEDKGFEQAFEDYAVPHQAFTSKLEQDTRALGQLVSSTSSKETRVDDQKVLDDLEKMNADIFAYEQDFERLMALTEERGTTESGLEGDYRQKAGEIEEMIRAHEQEKDLLLALLELRLAEEEYLLHRSKQHADQVVAWYHRLFGEIEDATDLSRQEKTEIEILLDTYDTEFETVVAIDAEILVLQADMHALYQDIEMLAIDIDDIGRHEATQEIDQAHLLTFQTIRIVTMCVIVVVVFGFGLTLAIAQQLKRVDQAPST